MNPFFEALIVNGLLLDALGVIGLGLIGFAAARLYTRNRSWGGPFLMIGAVCLLTARFFILARPALLELGVDFSGISGRITLALPPFLLTIGLAGVVWGVWAHERWLRESR